MCIVTEIFTLIMSACLCRFSLTDAGVTLAIRMLKSSTTAHDQGTQQAQDQLCDRSLSEESQPITNEQGSPILLGKSCPRTQKLCIEAVHRSLGNCLCLGPNSLIISFSSPTAWIFCNRLYHHYFHILTAYERAR